MNRKVAIFSISLLPLMVSSGMMYSVLPLYISDELGANRIQIGLLFTTAAITGTLTSIYIGKLADRVGRKPLILLAQILFAMVMLVYSSIKYYLYAFPVHVLEGFAWASVGVAAPAFIADITGKDERGEAMGIYNTVWSLGWVIGPFLGGTLAEIFGFRFMLRVSFLMIISGLVLSAVFIRGDANEQG